jgi:hypothetical protein
VAPLRGEGTKAILVRGEAEKRLVPFVFDGVKCLVPAGVIRHHPNHPECPVVLEALAAPESWRETVTKGSELRARTVRCTGGCWEAYEAEEQRRIARGDEGALQDWQEAGIRARAELVRRVTEGLLPDAYIEK